jgi:hypothetical protein
MIENDVTNVQPENDSTIKKTWEPPSVTSFKPVSDTQGLSYRMGDGLSNLT